MMPTDVIKELMRINGYVVESKYAVHGERTAWLTLCNGDCKVTFKSVYESVHDMEEDIYSCDKIFCEQ